MKTIRDKFVEDFGEEQAEILENAANEHDNDVHHNKGSDPFKWVLSICIGYECFINDRYREYHKITIPLEQLKKWVKQYAELGSHDGDIDYLALVCNKYQEYIDA